MRFIILITTLSILLSGCATASLETIGKHLDTAIKYGKLSNPAIAMTELSKLEGLKQKTDHSKVYALTVEVTPKDSIVKIMNIKPKYHDGIQLGVGAYDILVQREGYKMYRQWINISTSDVTRNVVLNPLSQQTASTSSPTTTQESSETEEDQVQKPVEPPIPDNIPFSSVIEKVQDKQVSESGKLKAQEVDPTLRADYFPPKLSFPSKLAPAEVGENDVPVFDGGYLKVVDKGFFTDDVSFVELEAKKAYPHAQLLQIQNNQLTPTKYEETEHYQVTKDFLNNCERTIKYLIVEIQI